MSDAHLDDRQSELIRAFVQAWVDSDGIAFDFDVGGTFARHSGWPDHVPQPSREEVRALVLRGLLEADRTVAPAWRVFPSSEARRLFGGDDEVRVQEALGDADRRLGVILEATVQAFEADASEPLHFAPMEQVSIVQHPHWPLAPDVVRSHDLSQLADLGLIGTEARGTDTAFWPTSDGRLAAADPAEFLDRHAAQTSDERERARLLSWVKKLRAGDIAVGALSGASGAAIRALVGL